HSRSAGPRARMAPRTRNNWTARWPRGVRTAVVRSRAVGVGIGGVSLTVVPGPRGYPSQRGPGFSVDRLRAASPRVLCSAAPQRLGAEQRHGLRLHFLEVTRQLGALAVLLVEVQDAMGQLVEGGLVGMGRERRDGEPPLE